MSKKLKNTLFLENEQRVNSLIVKIMWILTPLRLIPTVMKMSGVSPSSDTVSTLINTILLILLQTAVSVYNVHRRKSANTKYFILCIFQFVVFTLSMQSGVEVSLLYLVVPMVTLFYYDLSFTTRISLLSYVCMLLTLLYRAFHLDMSQYSNMPRIVWIRAYAVGMTIEYTLSTIVILFIARSIQRTMSALDEKEKEAQKAKHEERAKSLNTQFDQQKIITGFANLVETRDLFTGEHIKRTRAYVNLISQRMKDLGIYPDELTAEVQEYITQAAPLHDIGKICVPDHILTKNGSLTEEEREKMKEHSEVGERIIKENLSYLDPKYVDIAAKMARYHHERWDGRGYPDGLRGREIPLCARIMSVADVLDALLSRRSYKMPIALEEALKIMKEASGSQFDPECIKALLECADEIPTLQRVDEQRKTHSSSNRDFDVDAIEELEPIDDDGTAVLDEDLGELEAVE